MKGIWNGSRARTIALAMTGVAVGLAGFTGAYAGEDSATKTVRLIIDYGDGVEKHFTALPWSEGMTAFDALRAANRHPRGIEVEHKDYGGDMGYLVTRIDDLENAAGGKEGRNWIYQVNDELAKKACNKYELDLGAVVRWSYKKAGL